MATATDAVGRPLLIRTTPQFVLLFLAAAIAAGWTVVKADGMWDMPGTMGYALPAFIGMWTLMMAAMMLPSVASFASMYSRTVRQRRLVRLTLFALGYMAVWALMGFPAYFLAWLADQYAGNTGVTVLAVAIFATAGVYQLTPLKYRCLSHCRTPMSHLLHFAGLKGPLRDLRVGLEHGYFCAVCCWGLMAIMVALGVMNVPAMILLASVVAIEKLWRWGEYFSRMVGVAAIAAAIAVIWVPELAPGLTNEPMNMDTMGMHSTDVDAGAPRTMTDTDGID